MKKFFLNLQFIFMPNYWIMNEPYCKQLDQKISDLLDKEDFKYIDNYTAKLGNLTIWIENQPYACMMPYQLKFTCRPSRLTIKRGLKKLRSNLINELISL